MVKEMSLHEVLCNNDEVAHRLVYATSAIELITDEPQKWAYEVDACGEVVYEWIAVSYSYKVSLFTDAWGEWRCVVYKRMDEKSWHGTNLY